MQSESGRIDYDKSDHAPKGTQMAGDVVAIPMSIEQSMKGAAGHAGNVRAVRDLMNKGPSTFDTTNLARTVVGPRKP